MSGVRVQIEENRPVTLEPVAGAAPLPREAERWSGQLPGRNISWAVASPHIVREAGDTSTASAEPASAYHTRFLAGATLFPQVLVIAEDAPRSPLGVAAGRRAVRSRRDANEKPPWKGIASLDGSVEQPFVRPVHFGATLLPFRLLAPHLGVIPWDGSRLLEGRDERIEAYPGLASWWRSAEALWESHRSDDRLSLVGRVDYRHGLSQQFPTPQHRVLYTASGQYLAAARIDDPDAIIEHKLYWAAANSVDEARFLVGVLNCAALTALVAPMQSRGEHNPRDFDKQIWRLPIPLYDAQDERHRQLVQLAAKAEGIAAETDVSAHRTFQAQRRLIREELESQGVSQAVDALVADLLTP